MQNSQGHKKSILIESSVADNEVSEVKLVRDLAIGQALSTQGALTHYLTTYPVGHETNSSKSSFVDRGGFGRFMKLNLAAPRRTLNEVSYSMKNSDGYSGKLVCPHVIQ
jgi:hypothetical protein